MSILLSHASPGWHYLDLHGSKAGNGAPLFAIDDSREDVRLVQIQDGHHVHILSGQSCGLQVTAVLSGTAVV
jgi:hypothetical protein